MRKLISCCLAITMLFLTTLSCSESYLAETDSSRIPSVTEMVTDLYLNFPDASYDDVEEYVCTCYGITPERYDTKCNYYISNSALELVDIISNVDPSTYETKEDYIKALTELITSNAINLNDGEEEALTLAASIAADVIELQYGGVDTKGFKDWCKKQWENWGRCAAGTVGGAGLGALAGAGIAAIETVGIGAGVGAIIGGISGALSGAADAC